MQAYCLFFKQWLYIFCQKLSNENKQRLYKIQKSPTSLFYHVLLIKQNECIQGRSLVIQRSVPYSIQGRTDYYKNYGEDKPVWHKLVLTMTFDIPAPRPWKYIA